MRALLDVNVLTALLDEAHIHHARAMSWLERNIEYGWATSPITQNGCMRIHAYHSPARLSRRFTSRSSCGAFGRGGRQLRKCQAREFGHYS